MEILLEGVNNPKVKIEKLAQDKIDYLLRRFPNNEWSGTLFYTIDNINNITKGDLVITVIDLLIQDIGTSVYTKMECDGREDTYSLEKGYLLDPNVYTGFIHSHHKMEAYFSGTDESTLEKQGLDVINFFSLIVNTRNKYAARLTLQVKEKLNVVSNMTCTTLGNITTKIGDTETFEQENIHVFYRECDVIQNNSSEYSELEEMIVNIEKSKAPKETKFPTLPFEKITKKEEIKPFTYSDLEVKFPKKWGESEFIQGDIEYILYEFICDIVGNTMMSYPESDTLEDIVLHLNCYPFLHYWGDMEHIQKASNKYKENVLELCARISKKSKENINVIKKEMLSIISDVLKKHSNKCEFNSIIENLFK